MSSKRGKSEKGFTLIELMVVILIVGILSAVAIPYMRGRVDTAKWSEGKAMAGSIRTAARAYCAEKGPGWFAAGNTITDYHELGFNAGDLDGRFFSDSDYRIVFNGFNDYDVYVDVGSGGSSQEPPVSPQQIIMHEDGSIDVTP